MATNVPLPEVIVYHGPAMAGYASQVTPSGEVIAKPCWLTATNKLLPLISLP